MVEQRAEAAELDCLIQLQERQRITLGAVEGLEVQVVLQQGQAEQVVEVQEQG